MNKVFKPVGDMILIEEFQAEDKSKGGIIMPSSIMENHVSIDGIVVAVSPEVEVVEEGDHVMFKKHSGTIVAIEGDTYLCIPEKDLLGIIP